MYFILNHLIKLYEGLSFICHLPNVDYHTFKKKISCFMIVSYLISKFVLSCTHFCLILPNCVLSCQSLFIFKMPSYVLFDQILSYVVIFCLVSSNYCKYFILLVLSYLVLSFLLSYPIFSYLVLFCLIP